MSVLLKRLLAPYMAPAGDEAASGGAAVDRGDDFTPTDDAPVEKTAAAAPAEDDDPDDIIKDAQAAKEEHEEPEKPKKDSRIPLSRHEAILNRERDRRAELEKQLERFQQGEQVAKTNAQITDAEDKIIGLEKEYAKLLADGNADAAAAKMAEIRRLDRSVVESKTRMETEVATARAVEQVRYDMAVERIEEAYPALNPDHDDFDQAKAQEVLELRNAYVTTGKTPTEAMQKAVKYVMGAPDTARQRNATEVTPRVTKEQADAATAKDRKADAVKRNTDVASKQPPSLSKVGENHDAAGGTLDAKKVANMPYEQFVKLDDAALSRLRGDEFVGA